MDSLFPLVVAAAVASTMLGCRDTHEGDDSGPDGDGDVDAGEHELDSGTDAGGDGGGTDRIGMAGRQGSGIGTVDGYAGTEEIFFLADEGNGEAICRITYTLNSTGAPAQGCEGCLWAFELVLAEATLAEERDVGCEATVGIDPARVGDLDGTHVSYGYDPTYVGHGSVLMSRLEDGQWAPETFATWDEQSGAFSYRRVDGFPAY